MRPVPLALGGVLMVVAAAMLSAPGAGALPDSRGEQGSALTKSGAGEFADLRVSVSQTRELVNQIVRVSWEGGEPTNPEFGNLNTNYLQIMQCWGGTPDEGPPREQCQYGSLKSSTGGQNTNSRQMTTAGVIDPLEEDYEENAFGTLAYIPFDSWTGKRTTGPKSEFFDRNTSNESNHNRTRADGTGEDFFEIQTGVEAPGLGCGQVREDETPLCWLVVVPRGSTEVDGTPRGRTYTDPLDTSPLMASNWAHRIVFPLDFQPVGASCAFGASEMALLGSERMAEAVTRWQPALCKLEERNYSFTVISDDAARSNLLADKPALGFVTFGLPEEEVPKGGNVVYAPVALSGLVIAFNLESQSSTLAPDDIRARDGSRITGIKLNARLLAKMLTQTYRFDAEPQPGNVASNPFDLAQDPEFLRLNPQFEGLRFPGVGHVLTTAGQTDSARLLWQYIWSDKDARDFLKGKPDPWGTTLNKAYSAATFPRQDFPREDNQCRTYSSIAVPICTFDLLPYAGDLATAARAASRGDSMARGVFDPASVPPAWKRSPVQEPGRRSMIAVVDSPLTERFALTPAALLNAAGEYVVPTTESMRAAAKAATSTSVPAVLQPDPTAEVRGAYPLTSYLYAATAPERLSRDEGDAYADLLEYVAAEGQVLGEAAGQLPRGYVPLTDEEQDRTRTVAQAIRDAAGTRPTPAPSPSGSPSPSPSPTSSEAPPESPSPSPAESTSAPAPTAADPGGTDSDPGGTYTDPGMGASVGSEVPPPVLDQPQPETPDTGSTTDETVVEPSEPEESSGPVTGGEDAAPGTSVVAVAPVSSAAIPTPTQPIGAIRYAAAFLLFVGAIALLGGAVLAHLGRRKAVAP